MKLALFSLLRIAGTPRLLTLSPVSSVSTEPSILSPAMYFAIDLVSCKAKGHSAISASAIANGVNQQDESGRCNPHMRNTMRYSSHPLRTLLNGLYFSFEDDSPGHGAKYRGQ